MLGIQRYVISAVVGLLAATVAVAMLGRSRSSQPPPESSGRNGGAPTVPQAASTVVYQLPAALPTGQPAATPQVQAAQPSAPDEPMTPEEARKRVDDAHANALTRHAAEPRSEWGTRAEGQFAEDLARVAKQADFQLVDIDCRTVTCAGTLDFGSVSAAQRGWLTVATNHYTNNCSTEVLLDDPSKAAPGSRLRASVLYDCTPTQGTAMGQ